jgi:hypothetical protein
MAAPPGFSQPQPNTRQVIEIAGSEWWNSASWSLSAKRMRAGEIAFNTEIPRNCAKAIVNLSRAESINNRRKL